MSTQYNVIQVPYGELRTKSVALMERENIREAVVPFIKGASVLDLACGSGYYSYSFLEWGARKVVGIDISSAMVDEARAAGKSRKDSDCIEFQIADCSKPIRHEGGPFDIVFGAWLLNYAPSGKDMTDMFRNISLNLKDGGHFVGICPVPRSDPAKFVQEECNLRPLPTASGGLYCTMRGTVEDGVAIHAYGNMKSGELNFDCYHLRKDVYEAAAKDGGMRGEVEWSVTRVPHEYWESGKTPGGADEDELESYNVLPHYGMLVVSK